MFSAKNFTFFCLAVLTAVIAGPAAELNGLVAKDNCNNFLGRCDQNGCAGVYTDPNALHGTCTAGTFDGCPCNKCGNTNGACTDNGCFGENGVCTAGIFQGCPCDS
ncbi:hypothetical protein C8R47DRAFT_1219759 [Mycena vitilis]|nr:hypothetical protein C8R47DRAFT_1219759 [Mycena vitilis]